MKKNSETKKPEMDAALVEAISLKALSCEAKDVALRKMLAYLKRDPRPLNLEQDIKERDAAINMVERALALPKASPPTWDDEDIIMALPTSWDGEMMRTLRQSRGHVRGEFKDDGQKLKAVEACFWHVLKHAARMERFVQWALDGGRISVKKLRDVMGDDTTIGDITTRM